MSFLSSIEHLLPRSNATFFQFVDGRPRQFTVLFQRLAAGGPALDIRIPYKIGFTYVLSGKGTLSLGDTSYELTAGSLFIIDASQEHRLRSDPGQTWCECSLSFGRRLAHKLRDLGVLLEHEAHVNVGLNPSLLRAYRRCHRVLDELADDPDGIPSAIAATIEVLIARQRAIDQGNDDFLNQAKRLLAARCSERNAVELVADELGMGYHAFRRRFKQQTGDAPGAWQIRYRIGQAYELLRSHSIDEVADQLGYADRFTFSRQFKQVTGNTPGQARRDIAVLD